MFVYEKGEGAFGWKRCLASWVAKHDVLDAKHETGG